MSHSMNRAEREEFLAGLHVGVLSVDGGDAHPAADGPGLVHLPARRGGQPEHRPG